MSCSVIQVGPRGAGGRGRRLGGESECMSQDEQPSAQCEAPPSTLDAGKAGLHPLLSGALNQGVTYNRVIENDVWAGDWLVMM